MQQQWETEVFLSQHTLEMHAKSVLFEVVLFEVIIPGDVSTIFSQFGRLPRPDLTSSRGGGGGGGRLWSTVCRCENKGSQNLTTHRVLQFEIDAPFFTVSSQKVAFKCCKCIKTHGLLLQPFVKFVGTYIFLQK